MESVHRTVDASKVLSGHISPQPTLGEERHTQRNNPTFHGASSTYPVDAATAPLFDREVDLLQWLIVTLAIVRQDLDPQIMAAGSEHAAAHRDDKTGLHVPTA